MKNILFIVMVVGLFLFPLGGDNLDDIYRSKQYLSRRISSWDQTGGNRDRLKIEANSTRIIADIHGAGIIKHIWITISCKDPMIRRNAIIRMFWDQEKHPSVESPIGDFFGQGWGESYRMISLPIVAAPVKGNAINCFFPMPFSTRALITIENQSEHPIGAFYYYIDYEKHKKIQKNTPRFHAWWNRQLTDPLPEGENEWSTLGKTPMHPKSAKGNYIFADITGQGHFVGVNYYVDCPTPMWYGEGDDMFFIDGEKWPPSLHGTGTEDFFNTSWCPKEIFMHPYFGYPRVNNNIGWLGRTHIYRFLIESPVAFKKSLLATIEHGHANNLTLDICTVAYWYQVEPHQPFPPMLAKEKRQNRKAIGVSDIHRWRDAWRKNKGQGTLWGNEKKERKQE